MSHLLIHVLVWIVVLYVALGLAWILTIDRMSR